MKKLKEIGLFCLSKGYEFVTSTRNRLYERGVLKTYRASVPVISVGNITVGGNAKTPLCLYLASELKAKGYTPVILSRGYGGSLKGPHLVQPTDAFDEVGDEPLLMAQQFAVVVAKRRALGAKYVAEKEIGDVIILDDGFQHRRLERDVNIVSVNVSSDGAVRDFLRGRLLPWGRFREARSPALRRADYIVFADRSGRVSPKDIDSRLFDALPRHLKIFRSFVEPVEIRALDGGHAFAGGEVVALCGIANPDGFFDSLSKFGCTIVAKRSFIDHYSFTAKDLAEVQDAFPGLPIVCTEKDAVKLRELNTEGVYALNIRTRVHPSDAFVVQIEKSLLNRSGTAASSSSKIRVIGEN